MVVNLKEAPNDSWSITISTYLDSAQNNTLQGQIIHTLDTDVMQITEIVQLTEENQSLVDGEVKIDFTFTIPKVFQKKMRKAVSHYAKTWIDDVLLPAPSCTITLNFKSEGAATNQLLARFSKFHSFSPM